MTDTTNNHLLTPPAPLVERERMKRLLPSTMGFYEALISRILKAAPYGQLTLLLPAEKNGHRRAIRHRGLPISVMRPQRDDGSLTPNQQTLSPVMIEIQSKRGLRRLMTGGDMGFAEAFMDGDINVPDLHALFHWFLANGNALEASVKNTSVFSRIKQLANLVLHRLHGNSKRGSKRNIAYHYDLGNSFYKRWLDETMTYSSALFEGLEDADTAAQSASSAAQPHSKEQRLNTAQSAKYQAILDALALPAGPAHILEIGCGWGGFAEHALKHRTKAGLKTKVTGLTISAQQLHYGQSRLKGFEDKADIRFEDYRDCKGTYDGIASIEMFEAVGEAHWPEFFTTLHDRLKPGARAALQIITIDESRFESYRRGVDFIQRYIFPGGMLSSPTRFEEEAERVGLTPLKRRMFGLSYAHTLRCWLNAFDDAWPELASLGFDERFRRMWRYYLQYCEAGFEAGRINVGIFTLERPQKA